MSDTSIVILGGGPAGVGAAYALLRDGQRRRVTVIEQRERVGGNAGSFELAGQRVDFGSHRLHPACDPAILADIRRLMGEKLVQRPRHGRIRLRNRWIHFPLKPVDLLLRLDPAFAAGALRDMATGPLRKRGGDEKTFADVLHARLGPTICEHFYFPYARKIWGVEPEALSATQAHRRVAANSFGKLLRKLAGQLPGFKPVGFRYFYYPLEGYGAISEAYAGAARDAGAEIRLGRGVSGLERTPAGTWLVDTDDGARLEADHVWSTLPITVLSRLVSPAPPEAVRQAAAASRYRSMMLVYLTLGVNRYTEFDAHYFPGPLIPITRLSEPKNYAALEVPRGSTTLCAELPCSPEDEWWEMDEPALGAKVAADLEAVGLPPAAPLDNVLVKRLRFAYPIYETGYEENIRVLDDWATGLPGVLTYGRQGLFAHDNTHHALAMAYAAADCLSSSDFDAERWAGYRREFEKHVVED